MAELKGDGQQAAGSMQKGTTISSLLPPACCLLPVVSRHPAPGTAGDHSRLGRERPAGRLGPEDPGVFLGAGAFAEGPSALNPAPLGDLIARGAEAELRIVDWMGRRALAKRRIPKPYRLPALDAQLRQMRTKTEARLLRQARQSGVPTPLVYDVALAANACILTMELIEGEQVKRLLNAMTLSRAQRMMQKIGQGVGALHQGGIIHGDLTTSNMLWYDGRMYFIDFGLGAMTDDIEARGVDLRVLKEAFGSTHAQLGASFDVILKGYNEAFDKGDEAIERMNDIAGRGRYTE